MIRSLISILFLFSPGVLYSQFDIDNYLGSARSDINVNEIQNKLEYLGANKITSPVLNRVEMRIQTDDLNLSPEDLRLRVSPTNPYEISMNKQYHKIQVNKLYNDVQFNLNLALRIRYDLLINYLYIKEKIILLDEEAIRLKDELAVIRGDSEFEPLDVEGMVDMELNNTELLIDQTEYASRLNKELIAIKSLFQFSGDIPFNINDLISAEKLTSVIAGITPTPDSSNVYISNAVSDFDLRTGKYQVDMAEARRNMGFLETNYKTARTEPFRERLGFEIGIRLPITNEDKADLRRSYLDLIEDRFEIARQEHWLSEEQQFALINVIASVNKFNIVDSKLKQLFPGYSMDPYNKNPNNDPNDLLNIKNTMIKLKNRRLELLYELYLNYSEFLDVSGKLSESPLINYLSPQLNQY